MTWNWLLRFFAVSDDVHVSDRWLSEQQRRDEQTGFEGPCIRWPINKFKNEHALFNTQRLKKRA